MSITLERPKRNGTRPAPLSAVPAPPRPTSAEDYSPTLRLLIVVAAMIGAVLEVLDTSITNVAVPQMEGNLGATLSQIGWVSTGYIISNVIVLPLTGWLAERYGRKRYFAASIILFTIASLFCGLSHSLGALIFWRVVQGLGGGGLLSTGQVIMLQAFPKSQQGIATAIFGMGVMIGPSLGPVLGGYLTDNLTWPWIFFINLPFGILAAILAVLFVPDGTTGRGVKGPVDVWGVVFLTVGMGSLQTVLERGQEEDWFSSNLIITLSISAALGLILFLWHELSTPYPIVNLRVLKDRSLAAGSLFGAVLGVGLYAVLFLLPVYLQNSQGYTAFETGMILMPSALISMVSFLMAGPLTQKYDARVLLLIGVAFFATGAYGLSMLTTQSGAPDVFWPLALRGMSLGFLFIPLTVASLGNLKPEDMGAGSGMINLTRQLGGRVGIAAFSTLLTRRDDFHRSSLVSHITDSNPNVHVWLSQAQSLMMAHGYSASSAKSGAMAELSRIVEGQAAMLSFNDAYLMITAAFMLTLPLIAMFKKSAVSVDASAAH